jgi:AcrR family transcriptional regulator
MNRRRKHRRQSVAASLSNVPPSLLRAKERSRPTVQKRSAITRERLENAGLELFAKKGFEGTSIAEIAKRANVAIGAFYIYFQSKRDLLLVLMDQLLSALGRLNLDLRTEGHPQIVLRAFLEQAFSYDMRYLGAYRAWQEAISSDADLRSRDKAIRAWSQHRVRTLVNHLQLLPGARRSVDLDALSAVLDRLLWSLLGEMLIASPAEQRKRLRTAADLAYHAIFRDEENAR